MYIRNCIQLKRHCRFFFLKQTGVWYFPTRDRKRSKWYERTIFGFTRYRERGKGRGWKLTFVEIVRFTVNIFRFRTAVTFAWRPSDSMKVVVSIFLPGVGEQSCRLKYTLWQLKPKNVQKRSSVWQCFQLASTCHTPTRYTTLTPPPCARHYSTRLKIRHVLHV